MKYKIISEWNVNKYKVLQLDKDINEKAYNKYFIDGICYSIVPVYDLPRNIAIEANGEFTGKTVECVMVRD